jgi:hypothetical protein
MMCRQLVGFGVAFSFGFWIFYYLLYRREEHGRFSVEDDVVEKKRE